MSLLLALKKYKEGYIKDLEGYTDDEFGPKKSRNLRAVSFEYKTPLGNGKYELSLVQCTEWDNGEGFDFTITHTAGSENRSFSLHTSELDAILFCVIDIYNV